jgi:limonene-1,2-epoxide hydrolase
LVSFPQAVNQLVCTPALGPQAVVEQFFAACHDLDFEAALELIDDNCVYQNAPFHTARGKERIRRDLGLMFKRLTAFDADMVNIAVNDGVVLTERVDHLGGRLFTATIPLMGAFVVEHGRITQWCDYFDWSASLGKMSTSVFTRWFD